MMIFALNCMIGSFFIYFVVSETRGRHMDQLKTEQKVEPRNENSRVWSEKRDCSFHFTRLILLFWMLI